jgi:hypothetical protein
MGFSVGANSARYRVFPSKSQDLFNLAIAYQFFLDAFSGTHKIETGKPLPDHVTAGLITADTLLVGFQNTLAATPTFHAYSVDLFTPQAVLTRQNINLSDKVYCYNRADTASRKDPRFCTSADLSVAIGQTFSDLGTQQNANLAVAGTLYQRINETDFTVGLQVIATGKTYETYRGGRRDIVFQEGPLIRFTPTPDPRSKLSVSMALAVNFFQQHSTVAANSWRGIVVQPSVTVRF